MAEGVWATASSEDRASVKAWFDTWGAHVAAREFEPARDLFADEALGFGTWMDFVDGVDALEAKQWRSIWGTIRDFHHQTDDALQVTVSPDRLQAVGLVLWTSTGFHESGAPYKRPGRTTAVLTRTAVGEPWQCVHTHVSLARGVPQKSFGDGA